MNDDEEDSIELGPFKTEAEAIEAAKTYIDRKIKEDRMEVVDDPTMVERVARAIWSENQPQGAPAYDDLDFLDQGRVKMIARACIKAMREPTDEMVTAIYVPDDSSLDVGPIWRLMIDAALKED